MAKTTPYPFQDHTLALDQRVEDLVSRLNAEEKIEAMLQYQPAVERLGVKAYKHGTEAAHGIAWLGEATYFPQPVGLACTWDAELMQRIGNVISDEARVMYKRNPEVHGLTLWAPTVDMERDPRWGRNEEAYGEDPYLTGELTSKLVQGIQGDHPVYKKAVATLKHFLGNNNEVDRGSGSSSIDPRNMREYYLKAFERPFVEGQAKSMMTAYNSINGTPALMHPLVHEVVKNEWKMDGFIVSDAGDVMGIMRDHGYYDSHTPGVAASIKAGIDSITDDADLSKAALREALEQGLLDWNDIDTALHNTFRVRLMLGEFDPEELNPYAAIGEESMLAETARATATEATRKSVVLLKNDDHKLPLSATSTGNVAIIGELGGVVYRDWYSGSLPYAVTAVEAIRNKVAGDVHYTDGNDRIRLRTTNGELLHVRVDGSVGTQTEKGTTGSNQDAGASESAIASHSATADRFILSDWGYDSYCLRSEATGTYLAADDEQQRLATATDEVYGWFAKEVLRLIEQPDGHIGIRTWNGRELYWDQTEGTVRIAEGEHRYPPVQAEWQIPAAARATLGDVEATVSVEEIAPSSIIPEPASAQAIGSTEAFHFSKEVLENGVERAAQLATEAETAIVFVGNHPLINGKEEVDRPGLELAASQLRMVQQVYAANPNTVVVVVGSYPFTMDWIQQHIPAIVYITHAGPELGNAIADVLYGDYAPAGRLNMTWYRSAEQLGNLLDYDIIRSGRTYQYFEGEVLYPFGHGLTYSPMSYSELKLSANTLQADAMLTVQVTIQNEGGLDSDEVVQLYTRSRQSRVKQPLKTLRAFQRVHIQAGQSIQVQLQLPVQELAFWDVTRSKYVVETGAYDVLIGRSSSDIRLEQSIQIEGETIPPRDPYQTIRAENYDNYQAIHLIEANDGGAATEAINDNAWLLYTDMNFNSSVSSLTACLSSQTNTPEIKVYIDNIDSEPIASLSVPVTEESTSTVNAANSTTKDWQEVTADIKNPSLYSIQAVYLVPAQGTRISEFRFNPAKL
ncbi:glycoside hydrolase family 3 protein [Paenibacillus hunanensis]|uniref:Beta-glucosidase n=1 Tax=Paenibacillus hunanensis TaxID=539262 RepID=A0ABU1IUS8_9BACL|nr:glycoside hydrolase family 3 protein [Paenibacillus hunanensis]MDR6242765.1 beta-glucosidase [Paenibacillus hunanensis]GGJ02536.1 glucan 1,4-alpha-glucosidase [Paenibacillus hunanensis]